MKADGSVLDYPPARKQYTLKELQAAVGGSIEIAYPPDKRFLIVVNEEGKLEGLPLNRLATELYGADPNWDYVVGDALVCLDGDID
ncbi:MAG: DUF3846 domain-containing protein [Chloroflexi bacterium]|nr:DUF3846 domain-containing protein [Chloroflexota bacterium]